jgi:hypothetical protein
LLRTQRSYSNSLARRRREQTRDPVLTEQHNWNAFLDSASKTEERLARLYEKVVLRRDRQNRRRGAVAMDALKFRVQDFSQKPKGGFFIG